MTYEKDESEIDTDKKPKPKVLELVQLTKRHRNIGADAERKMFPDASMPKPENE